MRFIPLVAILLINCSTLEKAEYGNTRSGYPDQESWGVKITLTDEGVMRALVKSGHLEKFNDRQYILLDNNVNVDFFDDYEQHTTNLISQIAEVDERTNFMTAIGNVIVVSDSGVTLYTDTLMWNSEKELIYTDDPIILTTEKNDTLYGIGFESDVSMDHWKILQPSGVGPNGAGKTTTFYMITGMIKPTKGQIFLDDKEITSKAMYMRARSGIGYLAQEPSIFGKLTVENNLRLVLEMTTLSKEGQIDKIEKLLEEMSIQHIRNNKGHNLSGGERRRVEICRALAMDPDFILLDEPFAGVDPIAVEDIQSIVKSLKEKDIGVLITDHNVRETLSITDRSR